ncbi:hypothetical protein [Streptomyces sp. YIM 98790]|uniref:hypothetical protein n=1 Tax=Streptomyces sp. YIM 98790 TaxID=2689077 RepID=UPI00140DE8FF|nr:hypothetical protein [Streptomyces sp. YIM 98790]
MRNMKKKVVGSFGSLLMATGILAATAPTAQAENTVYTSNLCSTTTSWTCFSLYYTSGGSSPVGACFSTRTSISNHTSEIRSYGDPPYNTTARYYYIFGLQSACSAFGPGDGYSQSIRNNAAGAINRDSAAHTVFYSPGYMGNSVRYAPGASKLLGDLRNDNASSKRG